MGNEKSHKNVLHIVPITKERQSDKIKEGDTEGQVKPVKDVGYTYKILDENSGKEQPFARILRRLVEYRSIPIKADNYAVEGL